MVVAISVVVIAYVVVIASVQMLTDVGASVGATATAAPPLAALTPLLLAGAAVTAAAGGGSSHPEANVLPRHQLGVCCQYLQWQAICLVQHFHPVEVAKVLDDVAVAAIAISVAAAAAVTQQQRRGHNGDLGISTPCVAD